MKGAPVGYIGRAHPSGWIQTYFLFTQWFQHFIDYVKPGEASPVLLLFDGHFSHTKNIELVDNARENHVTLVSLPPHCTHKIQPLDKAFMGPPKTYYSEGIRVRLRENNRPTGEIAAKGFSVGGIYPLNRYVFKDSDYLAAAQEETSEHTSDQDSPSISDIPQIACEEPSHSTTVQPHSSSRSATPPNINSQENPGPSSSGHLISPFQISPVSFPRKKTSNRGRKSGKSEIISSSPYKKQLEETEKKNLNRMENASKHSDKSRRECKEQGKEKGKGKGKNKAKYTKNNEKDGSKSTTTKRKILYEESTDSDSDATFVSDTSKEEVPSRGISTRRPSTEDSECFYCNGKFTEDQKGEEWVQCFVCENWVHSECAGYDFGCYTMEKRARKSGRELKFTQALLEEAQARIDKGESKRYVAAPLGVNECSLRKGLGTIPTSLGRFKPVFSQDQEIELAEHIKDLEIRFYGLGRKQVIALTYQYAELNNISHRFNSETKMAGRHWIRDFAIRQNLSVRIPEKCSLARVMGLNRPQVNKFFENLKACYKKYNFQPHRIFDMDETGLSTVSNRLPKIYSQRGKKCVSKIVAAERGQLITYSRLLHERIWNMGSSCFNFFKKTDEGRIIF
nr:unnamed protein product [Callosobruchus chinensis]